MAIQSLIPRRLPYDILRIIIQNTEDRSTLYRLALTCRALSDTAMGELWHTMDSLIPLLLLIPMEFYDKDAFYPPPGCNWATPYLLLHFPAYRKDDHDPLMIRMFTYGKRIKVLRGVGSNGICPADVTLEFFFNIPNKLGVESIMPNLMELSLNPNELTDLDIAAHVCGLLLPSLRIIHFPLDFQNETPGVYESISDTIFTAILKCPKLVSLKFSCTERFQDEWPNTKETLDFNDCFWDSPELEIARLSEGPHPTSIKTIQIMPARPLGYCDIVSTPLTVVVFGLFKSLTHLEISLDTSEQFQGFELFKGPSSAFPALQFLRLRLHGSAPVTWFFDAINGTQLTRLYLHFVQEINTSELGAFLSSLDPFEHKFSRVQDLAFRATIDEEAGSSQEPRPVIQSLVAAAARLSPSLSYLKLKLYPSSSNTQPGLITAVDLPHIARAFPDLQTLKLATNPIHVHLTDVVAFAQRFPGLRSIGMNFQCSEPNSLSKDKPSANPPPDSSESIPQSGLRALKVNYSEVTDPERVAGYLRKSLPHISNVTRSRGSKSAEEWDMVDQLLSDRR